MDRPINRFLREHGLRIAQNPCVSPDFCLDWPALGSRLAGGAAQVELVLGDDLQLALRAAADEIDQLGVLPCHPQEITDNIADVSGFQGVLGRSPIHHGQLIARTWQT